MLKFLPEAPLAFDSELIGGSFLYAPGILDAKATVLLVVIPRFKSGPGLQLLLIGIGSVGIIFPPLL
jgi:hypothetical protein